MSRLGTIGARLYRGEVSYEFVGRARRWYAISAAILLISVLALLVRGLNLGVEFSGGAVFEVASNGVSVQDVRSAVEKAGVPEPIVQSVGSDQVRVQTGKLDSGASQRVQQALADRVNVSVDEIRSQIVGPSWGAQISQRALLGLGVFLLLVVLYLSLAFEPKMALAAIVALLHDLLITVGIYALVGFVVTPATVIGVLTILGYSLYDTVVVFDKVKENTRGLTAGSRMSYSQAANLAVNQTLVRSINTSVTALLPVAAILFVGAYLLGAGTLKDLSLALFVGIAAGTYSSIFIATPLLAQLKEREPAMQALRRRAEGRVPARPAMAAAGVTAGAMAGRTAGRARHARPGGPGDTGATAFDPDEATPTTGRGTDTGATVFDPDAASADAADAAATRPEATPPRTSRPPQRRPAQRSNKRRAGGKRRR